MKRYIFKLFTLTILAASCSTNPQESKTAFNKESITKMELQENLEWEEIETFITHFNDTTNLNDGKRSIIDFLTKNFPSFNTKFLIDLNIHDLKKDFMDWVRVPLASEKLDSSIKSLYFGIFISPDKRLTDELDEIHVLYIAGSSISPLDNPDDWAVDPDYLPQARYYIPSYFKSIDLELKKYNNTADVEQIIYNGLINLLLVNCKSEFRELLKGNSLHFGSGFDEGPAYYLGKI